MITIGLVSAATYGYMGAARTPGSFHGTAFASAFNGYDPQKAARYEWTFAAAERGLEGCRVVKIWDPQTDWAERLADVCSIPEVCQTAEECTEGVDAVIVVDDGSGEHYKYALKPLAAGIPTFIDKPIAMTARAAREVVEAARAGGAPLMSASSLRYVPDIATLKEELPALGDVHLATSVCGNDLVYYGIHALEPMYELLGSGAVSCLNVGQPDRNVVRVRYANGRDLLLIVAQPQYMAPGYQVNLYGRAGWRSVRPDLTDLYVYLLQKFVDMLTSGAREVVPLDEIVEVIAVLEAGKRSLEEGREVTVAEMLS